MRIRHIWFLAVSLVNVPRASAQMPPACEENTARAEDSLQCSGQPAGGLTTVSDHFDRFSEGFKKPLPLIQIFGAPALTAGISQWATSHKGFSGDASGYGYHYGVNLLGGLSGKFLGQFVLPVAFHQDDRYVRTSGASVPARIKNIFRHIVLAQSADGSHAVFNMSAVPNSLLTAALSNTYQPPVQRTAAASAQRFAWNMFGFSAGDAMAEFAPELRALGSRVKSGLSKLWPWHHSN